MNFIEKGDQMIRIRIHIDDLLQIFSGNELTDSAAISTGQKSRRFARTSVAKCQDDIVKIIITIVNMIIIFMIIGHIKRNEVT